MTDTVASLGFEVNSKPLDDAQAKLKGVADQAQNTGKAVDDLNQKLAKTGPAAGAAKTPVAGLATETERLAKQAGVSVGVLESMTARASMFGATMAEVAAKIAANRAPIQGSVDSIKSIGAAAIDAGNGAKNLYPLFSQIAGSGAVLGNALKGATPALTGMGSALKAGVPTAIDLNAALRGLGPTATVASSAFAGMARGIAAANNAIVSVAPKAQSMGEAISAAATRSAVSFDAMRAGIAAANAPITAVGAAAAAAAGGVRAKATALSDLDKAAQRMAPVLNQLQGGLGAVLGAANSFRLGLAGLAAVAGGAVLAGLAKVGDEAARTKRHFDALTGSQEQGARTLDAVKKAAGADTGPAFDAIAKAVSDASIGYEKLANKSVIYANAGDNATKTAVGFAEALGKLRANMDSNGATAEEMARSIGAIHESIKKTGGLTSEAFQKIRDESLPTARAISEAFGFKDIAAFQRELEKTPKSFEDLIRALNSIKPAAEPLKTLGSTARDVGKAWDDLVKTFGDAGGFTVARSAIEAIATIIKTTAGEVKALIAVFGAAGAAVASFADGAIAKLNSLAQGAIAAARQVASAVASMFSGSGAGGGAPSLSDTGDVSGGVMDAGSAGGTYYSQYGGDGSSGFDPSAMDYGGGSADYGYFASGGSFVVGGSGGTDSQRVTFKATPGEVVTVETPDQAGAIASLAPAPNSGTDLEDLFDEQTDKIVGAIGALGNSLRGSSGSGSAAAATTSVGSGAALGSFGAPAGGAMGSGQSNIRQLNEEEKKRHQARRAQYAQAPQGHSPPADAGGFSFAQGNSIRGSVGSRQDFPARLPLGEDGKALSGAIKDTSNRTERAIKEGAQKTDRGLDDVEKAGEQTRTAVDAASSAIVDATQTGFGGLQGALDTGLASIASAIASAISNSGGTGGSGGGWSGGGGYDAMGGYTGGGGYSGSDYGGGDSYSGGGSDSGYNGGGYGGDPYTGGSAGGFDPGMMDYGGGSVDAGYFAEGGSFKVPGAGNTDSVRVRFRAKPDETVTVTPPGVNVSPLMLNPGAGAGGDWAGYSPQVKAETTRNVNIYVQAGISAETVLRSRAQIQRAMAA